MYTYHFQFKYYPSIDSKSISLAESIFLAPNLRGLAPSFLAPKVTCPPLLFVGRLCAAGAGAEKASSMSSLPHPSLVALALLIFFAPMPPPRETPGLVVVDAGREDVVDILLKRALASSSSLSKPE